MRWAACTATAATYSTWSARRRGGSRSARRGRSPTFQATPPRSTPSATTWSTSATRRSATSRPARWWCWRPTATPTPRWAGGTKLLRLQENRCAGVLTDGRLRDFDELACYDFAAYCSGEATRWGGDHVTPFQAELMAAGRADQRLCPPGPV